jgi:NAD(P)H-flavin reductase
MMRAVSRELEARGVVPEAVHDSLERTMRCGVGLCGHCQIGPTLVCRDGAVYRYPDVSGLLAVKEL